MGSIIRKSLNLGSISKPSPSSALGIRTKFTTEQIVLLISFAGIMYATNLFNTVAKVPLDEVLYKYRKNENEEK